MSTFSSPLQSFSIDPGVDDDEEIGAFEVDDEPTLRTSVPLPPDSRTGRGMLLRQAAIGALAGSLMHDLASLLQAMEGALEEVAVLVGAGGPPGLREATSDAISAGRDAESLFMSMRRFLRDGEVISRPLDVERLVQRSLAAADAPLRKRTVRVGAMPPGAQVIVCEPLAIQVLVQLLRNAVQGAPTGAIDLEVEVMGDRVAFHVIDDGPGALPEIVDHLESPWALGEYATGFGLAVAAFVAQSHNGQLAYRAEPGRGSRFSALLPKV